MEMYVEKGVNRRECELNIMRKYSRPFMVWKERNVRLGGFLGLFTKEGVELEYYFPSIPSTPVNFEEGRKKVIAAAGKDPDETVSKVQEQIAAEAAAAQQAAALKKAQEDSQKIIVDMLQGISNKLGEGGGRQEEHPSLQKIEELLKLNDFSEQYSAGILARCKKELPLDTLADFDTVQATVLEWIGESISIYREPADRQKGRIMVLIGPTGMGKTTTIAKLAAIFGIENSGRPALSVHVITIDAVRIGAKDQLETICNIMEIPVSYADSRQKLKKEIALYSSVADLFLIDTFGESPNDPIRLGEMKDILDACGSKAETHLVIDAKIKTSDIEDILRQFEPFNYRSVLLAKLDETRHVGNVISMLAEKRKSVSYITDGQSIPNDIQKATVTRFLAKLEEFTVDREKMKKRFPMGEADQFQWS